MPLSTKLLFASGGLNPVYLGFTVTQSSKDVTGIDLSSVPEGSLILILYGLEANAGKEGLTSATLGGESASVDVSSESNGGSYCAICSIEASASLAGDSSVSFVPTFSSSPTPTRSAVAVFYVDGSAALVDTVKGEDSASGSLSIDFSSGGCLIGGLFQEGDTNGSITGFEEEDFSEMGSASADFFIGYSGFAASGDSTHSVTYSGDDAQQAFAAATYR
jgi:hypothetical protein